MLLRPLVVALVLAAGGAACAADEPPSAPSATGTSPPTTTSPRATASAGATASPGVTASPDSSASPSVEEDEPPAGVEPSDGTPRRATLTIPRLGLTDLPVVPYRGRPDDGPGTRIQDGGLAASPHGPRGGTGVGGVGNYIVTAHRLSSTQAFRHLPQLRRGDRVSLEAGGVRYVYEIRRTRSTSFRSPESLARQAAAVPGRPGAAPSRAMITLSTCATIEDHAAGNYWSDEFGNPEHRIDKIGVLVRVDTPAG